MVIFKNNVFGSNNLGVYLCANNEYFLHPPKTKKEILKQMREISPEIEPIELTINGGSVLGAYVAINSHGMIVPSIISDTELRKLKKNMKSDFSINVIKSGENAYGNLILCNDKGAIISSDLVNAKEEISKALQVDVKVLDFASNRLPGSSGKANNKGVIVHPMISEEDAEIIADLLDVNIDVSTINCGEPYLGGGMVANDHGGIFGRDSTGPELQRIIEILELDT